MLLKLNTSILIERDDMFTAKSEFCQQCSFREISSTGEYECLMNAIKRKWQTPSIGHYCDDPFAYKFIKLWNSKMSKHKDKWTIG